MGNIITGRTNVLSTCGTTLNSARMGSGAAEELVILKGAPAKVVKFIANHPKEIGVTAGLIACAAIGVGIYNHVKKKKSQEESK